MAKESDVRAGSLSSEASVSPTKPAPVQVASEAPVSSKTGVTEVTLEERKGLRLCSEGEEETGRKLKLPPLPLSSIQFQADWKTLRRDREMLAQYFKVSSLLTYSNLCAQDGVLRPSYTRQHNIVSSNMLMLGLGLFILAFSCCK